MLLVRSSSEVVIFVSCRVILQLICPKRNSLCLYSSTLGVSMDVVEIVGTPRVDHLEGGTSLDVDCRVDCLSRM